MNKLLNILKTKKPEKIPPIWIMRQAGRYLPEYREIRSNVGNFLDLCYNSELACEVTLQPIRRFDFDAAIIFSDILVIPDALGVKVEFIKNEGPKLSKITNKTNLDHFTLNNIENHLKPVFEALQKVRSNLSDKKSLIGFCGAPWTMACYMIEGGGSKNFDETKKLAIKDEKFFAKLIQILTDSAIIYLSKQVESGADVIKIFDSWAGILPPSQLEKWVIEPNKKIIEALRKKHPQTPIISFPRGIGNSYQNFVNNVKPDGIAIDQTLPISWAVKNLENVVLQGNLDNFLLAFGSKKQIEKAAMEILESTKEVPFIFNLGHGILQETPIENVEFLLDLIRNLDK